MLTKISATAFKGEIRNSYRSFHLYLPFRKVNGIRKVKDKDWLQNPSKPAKVIKFVDHETGNYVEKIQFSPNSEGYSRRVHLIISAGLCRHPLHCQTEP